MIWFHPARRVSRRILTTGCVRYSRAFPLASTDGEGWNGIYPPRLIRSAAWSGAAQPQHRRKLRDPNTRLLRHASATNRWVLGRPNPVRQGGYPFCGGTAVSTDIHEIKVPKNSGQLDAGRDDTTVSKNHRWPWSMYGSQNPASGGQTCTLTPRHRCQSRIAMMAHDRLIAGVLGPKTRLARMVGTPHWAAHPQPAKVA